MTEGRLVSAAPVPPDEVERLRELCSYNILDTPPEERFERLVRLVCTLLAVPAATVTFVDADRQWFKARRGVDASETPRDLAFCAHTILAGETLVVEDATRDARFADSPLVTDDGIRFYAGAPVRTRTGSAVGVLCAIDFAPRAIPEPACRVLEELAEVAADALALRKAIDDLETTITAERDVTRRLERSEARLESFLETASDWLWETDADDRFTFHSGAAQAATSPIGKTPWTFRHVDPEAPHWRRHRARLARHEPFRGFRYAAPGPEGERRHYEISGAPFFDDDGRFLGYRGCGRDVTAEVEALTRTRALARRLESLEGSPVIGICSGVDMRLTGANDAFLTLLGYHRADLEPGGLPLELLGGPAGRENLYERRERLLADGRCTPYEKELQRKDGAPVHAMVAPDLIDRETREWQALVLDVSDRKRAEARERELARRLQALEDSNVVGVMAGVGETIRRANDEFLRIVDRPRRELDAGALCWRALTPESLHARDEEARCELARGRRVAPYEKRFRRPDGSEVPVRVTAILVDPDRFAWEALVEDITDRKAAEARLLDLAYKDTLTGLWNRRSFNERLVDIVGAYGRGALIFVDLDHFKDVNDALGHDAGDALLEEIGRRLCACVRRDDVVARLGGDEFAVILQGGRDRRTVAAVAERMLRELKRPLTFGDREIHPGGSLGITCFPEDAGTVEDLLKNADVALYQAKDGGRRGFRFFDRHMREEVVRRVELAGDLRRALAGDEFELVFQPVVALADGRPRGVETLLRWHHPHRGVLAPDAFLEVAEDAGLLAAIGEVVIDKVVDRLAGWQRQIAGEPVVAVNVCAAQLMDHGFARALLAKLATAGVTTRCFEVEVTEDVLLIDNGQIGRTLQALRDAGISIALDDFGTGFASLTHLKRLPVDILKIDRSFVAEIEHDDESAVIARAIVNLAHNLAMRVVAEGIETDDQRDSLRRLGCDFGQGYLFARPTAGARVPQLLAAGPAGGGQPPRPLDAPG